MKCYIAWLINQYKNYKSRMQIWSIGYICMTISLKPDIGKDQQKRWNNDRQSQFHENKKIWKEKNGQNFFLPRTESRTLASLTGEYVRRGECRLSSLSLKSPSPKSRFPTMPNITSLIMIRTMIPRAWTKEAGNQQW